MARPTYRHTDTHRQQGNPISLLFFQNKAIRLKTRDHTGCAAGWKSLHMKLIFSKINHEFVHVNIRMLKKYSYSTPSEVMGNEGIAPRILNFDTKLMGAVNFISRRLYHRAKTSSTHFIGRWVSPQNGGEKIILALLDIKIQSCSPHPSYFTDSPTPTLPRHLNENLCMIFPLDREMVCGPYAGCTDCTAVLTCRVLRRRHHQPA
jgi:hypothetical protein